MNCVLHVIGDESTSNGSGKDLIFLSKKCTDMFALAEKTLDGLYSDISGGLIKLGDIKVVNDNKPQLMKLLKYKQSMDDFSASFERRWKEYTNFKLCKAQLFTFCHLMDTSELKIEGMIRYCTSGMWRFYVYGLMGLK